VLKIKEKAERLQLFVTLPIEGLWQAKGLGVLQ
jgi:hypothetical protein